MCGAIMTDPTVEAVARAINLAEFEDAEKHAKQTYASHKHRLKMIEESYNNYGRFDLIRATAAIEAIKALGWKPPEKPKLLADIS